MKQLVTTGIVLTRTNFGEADRIITLLTPDYGKLRLMAKGVRRSKSKLAGGVELFSISDIVFISGKGQIGTLVSSRLRTHYGTIVKDIDRVQLGYDIIKQLNRATEDETEAEYFSILEAVLSALDSESISLELIKVWFQSQLLRIAGHTPNLHSDKTGHKLESNTLYSFDFDSMSFTPNKQGSCGEKDIKFLRLLFDRHYPQALQKVEGHEELLLLLSPLVQTMINNQIRQ